MTRSPPRSRKPEFAATRRELLIGSFAAATVAVIPSAASAADGIVLNDASNLNATPVARHVIVKPDSDAKTIELLRRELRDAAAAGHPVSLGAARHSMGGQSLVRQGTAFTFDAPGCEADRAVGLCRVGPGARWHHVIAALDPLGFSPKVMQAYNDFGVASTFSVNGHGWPVPYGPFGSTVRAFSLMLADGTVVRASRGENRELFRHVMGGYGLFGIILDLDVEMVPNEMLQPAYEPLAANAFGARFPEVCTDPLVKMAYGRLDVSRDRFFEDALLISYRPAPAPGGKLPPAQSGGSGVVGYLSRQIYRAEVGSDKAKQFRWLMETTIGPRMDSGPKTRNNLLNWGTARLAERNVKRTDILHEYFVSPASFPAFLKACQDVIPRSGLDLLNVTLRFIEADAESILTYAPTRRIAAVMTFSQPRTAEADARMERMTRELIDCVLAIGGSFYLPYRLHARSDQLTRAYPDLAEFVACKRRYDPKLLFRNTLWDKWLAAPFKD
jgi:FAD/FMN-containing dehydrogenase